MKVYADIRQQVEVDPKDVIEKLIEKEIGTNAWVVKEDGEYFKCHNMGRSDIKEAISKSKFKYVKSLKFI